LRNKAILIQVSVYNENPERVLIDEIVGENKDIYKRRYAWKRKYDIEGTNVEHKAGMMNYLAQNEFDGFDYLDIEMQDLEGNYVGKRILPDGKTILTKVSQQGKFLGSIEGNINDNTNK